MIYAGIGSRTAPTDVLYKIEEMAKWLAMQGFFLRSGGANGCDKAFEAGCDAAGDRKVIYTAESLSQPWWSTCAAHFHPNWSACSEYAKKLHARNTPIILGPEVDEQWLPVEPSDFVLCWTKDGGHHGGTGQGLRIAEFYKIPVFNLFDVQAEHRLWAFLQAKGQI